MDNIRGAGPRRQSRRPGRPPRQYDSDPGKRRMFMAALASDCFLTLDQLAEVSGAKRGTCQKWISRLRQKGVPIESDYVARYRLSASQTSTLVAPGR
jgi:biotin operon repressor